MQDDSKVQNALEAFNSALSMLEQKMPHMMQRQQGAMKNMEEICADLRAEISSLKKQLASRKTMSDKVAREMGAVLKQIDKILN